MILVIENTLLEEQNLNQNVILTSKKRIDLLISVINQKLNAVSSHDYENAAQLRDKEKKLISSILEENSIEIEYSKIGKVFENEGQIFLNVTL